MMQGQSQMEFRLSNKGEIMNMTYKKIRNGFRVGMIVVFLCLGSVSALDNGLAKTPPMGWNSWNHFRCGEQVEPISEKLLVEMAQAMVSQGYKDLGYEYVNVDDCWMGGRNTTMFATDFFNGKTLKSTADKIHALGLKFGVYTGAGETTCEKKVSSLDKENLDIATFASWGIDYLKIDYCFQPAWASSETGAELLYKRYKDAVDLAGRPMVISVTNQGSFNPWKWGDRVGHTWRTTADIADTWDNISSIIDQQVPLYPYAKPGAWNDPDMLQVGRLLDGANRQLLNETRVHFGMWCMLASPLIMGNDLRNNGNPTNTPDIKKILQNKDLIAVDQDRLGIQAQKVWSRGDLEVWARPVAGANHTRVIALLNVGESPATITANWSDLNKWVSRSLLWDAGWSATVRDLWQGIDVAQNQKTSFSATVGARDVAIFKLTSNVPSPILDNSLTEKNIRITSFHRNLLFGFTDKLSYQVAIYDLKGQKIKGLTLTGPLNYSYELPKSGLYTVSIQNGSQKNTHTIVAK
jgi:alpha-galactosidase